MPLTDLVRLLNSPAGGFPHLYSRNGLDQPFVAAHGRVFLHYAGIRIESRFIPVHETRGGKLHGHAATIHFEPAQAGVTQQLQQPGVGGISAVHFPVADNKFFAHGI